MANTFVIRVKYPVREGRIVLRTDLDWERSIEVDARPDPDTWEFRIEAPDPFLYFKPCLVNGDQLLWSKGNNYLATHEWTAGRDLYPYFLSGTGGSISPAFDVFSRRTLAGHRIRVYQPPGYFENMLKRYPVLYMHDGKNLFFADEAFLGTEWRIDETMDLLDGMNVIDKVIVVGIYANERMTEYTRPGYEEYGRFIVEDLKPVIDASYRTLPGPANTAVMGSSLGGVVSLYLAWQWPQIFGKAACMSSTFSWYDDLMERITVEPKRALQLYMDSGWPGDNFEVTRSMYDLLASRGYTPGTELLYYAFPNELHNERYWAMRSHIPFQFFFRKAIRPA